METSDTGTETMATDVPGCGSLVTTLITGCYVTEQYTECLKLINSLNNGGQQEVFLLLVKGEGALKIFLKKIFKDRNPFCGVTDTPILDFW